MIQIDNYTDKEREVLALKGMTAPRTASERTLGEDDQTKAIKRFSKTYNMDIQHVNTGKPVGIRETQNEQDNREAAPNKAQPQHSPLTETSWPRHLVKSIETRKRDLVIRIADFTREKDAPGFDVEFYQAGVYDWNKSHSFDASMLGRTEAKRRAIAHAQNLIAHNL